MNIIHITESFAGGVYDFLVDLTNGLPDFKYSIIYGKRKITPENFRKDFPPNTIFFHWENAIREISPKNDLLALIELLKILKSIKNIDVIHLHSSKAGFLGRLATRILGMQNKVIYTSHGASFLRKDVSTRKKKQFEWLEKLAFKFGGNVIACSKSEAEEFNKIGIDASFIYNGINLNKCKLEKFDKSNSNENFIIGTIGRISHQKNPIWFNEIAKSFINNNEIKFLWIGDGELKSKLISPNIEITGWLNSSQVLKRLLEIDLYLSTSLWEGLPLSVLQAMCAKKPLLLNNCIGNKDLIISEKNGYLFSNIEESINKIKYLYENKNILKNLGKNSYLILENNFSIRQTLNAYKNLYKKKGVLL